jgi:hypothetical protein
MQKDSGQVERIGESGEKKSRIVGGFVGAVLIGVAVLLILAILYFALRKEKTVPPTTPQPTTQSAVLNISPYGYA